MQSELEALKTLRDEVQDVKASSQVGASRIGKLDTRQDDLEK